MARRGRFAPTPSGEMHIGNARTALLAWLHMRAVGGEFVMRIEDIDGPRSRPHYAVQALDDLRWLGMDWDEGPDVGGPCGPYTQSERIPLYVEAIDTLIAKQLLYPCYCSRAELMAVASAPHGLASEGPVYAGTCRLLTSEERIWREARKRPALRFIMPEQPIAFHDDAIGEVHAPPGNGGDFVIRRADDIVSYQLAVTVDDAAMHMTDVLRGYDLLDSTPRQLALYEALSLTAPRFAHIPLLVGEDGKRLAKRHGALSLRAMREHGVRPQTIVGALASLSGLHDRSEPIDARELIDSFRLELVPETPVVVTDEWLEALVRR